MADSQTLRITGMTCANCSARIERKLGKAPGISQVSVNLATEMARIQYDSSVTSLDTIRQTIRDIGYDSAIPESGTGASDSGLKRQQTEVFLSLILTAPFILAMMLMAVEWMTGYHVHAAMWFDQSIWPFLLATPIQFYFGRHFYRQAWAATLQKTADMNTLVALGTSAAYFLSLYLYLTGDAHHYFESSAMVISLVLLGKYLEKRSKLQTRTLIQSLAALSIKSARVIRDGTERTIPVADLLSGDVFVVLPGETIPADGVVQQGTITTDESMLTGESLPMTRQPGDKIFSGTLVTDGRLMAKASSVGEQTVLAGIIRAVEAAQGKKAAVQAMADRVSAVFVPVVLVIAAGTFTGWYFFTEAPLRDALLHAVAVLVISCPCALGLATPVALMVSLGSAARHGILIQNPDALDLLRSSRSLVFDKTGTLTTGKPTVSRFDDPTDSLSRYGSDLMTILGQSTHPLSQAIHRYLSEKTFVPASIPIDALDNRPGAGFSVLSGLNRWDVGSGDLVSDESGTTGTPGETVVHVALNRTRLFSFWLHDPLKPEAAGTITKLSQRNLNIHILSGDRQEVVSARASEAGLPHVQATGNLKPDEKAAHIQRLKESGGVVMAGDGINDAPALASATVSIAMSTGADLAITTSDISILNGRLSLIPMVFDLADRTHRTIRQNLFFAFLYNSLGIPLAAAGLLAPWIAGAAMALSSVSVVSNALRLRKF
ncbi:MAG: cation-translocating P-type ATPase [Bacteroidetes bacterium]|nr:cation-translocating P-type ATPase [Bacteroidota bacterium]